MNSRSIALTAVLIAGLGMAAQAGAPPKEEDEIWTLKEKALRGTTRGREEAVAKLGGISDENRLSEFKVSDFLLKLARDDANPSRVRSAAVEAVARNIRYVSGFADKALIPFIAILQDRGDSLYVRMKVAAVMANFLESEAVAHRMAFQTLEKVARDTREEPGLVAAALVTLGETGYVQALPVIKEAMKSSDPIVKQAALVALDKLLQKASKLAENADLTGLLISIARDEKLPAEMRKSAITSLAKAAGAGGDGANRMISVLVDILGKTKDPDLALVVVGSLQSVPTASSQAALAAAYETFSATPTAKGYANVRQAVAEALGEFFAPLATKDVLLGQKVAKTLMDIAGKDPAESVAVAALYSLGNMDSRKYNRVAVAQDLADAMKQEKTSAPKEVARESLVLVTGVDLGDDAEAWVKWVNDPKNKQRLLPR